MFFFRTRKIQTLEVLTLRITGMRYTEEYELAADGPSSVQVSRYQPLHGAQEGRQLQARAVRDTEEVIRQLNACRVLQWDGFHGKHPRGVKDGRMFSLSATVNGGKTVYADGSQNFPSHFHELTDWFRRVLTPEET